MSFQIMRASVRFTTLTQKGCNFAVFEPMTLGVLARLPRECLRALCASVHCTSVFSGNRDECISGHLRDFDLVFWMWIGWI
jgi:hypothetical protein